MLIRSAIRRLPAALVTLLCAGAANGLAAQQLVATADSAGSKAIRLSAARPAAATTGARTIWDGPVRGDVKGYATVLLHRSGPPANPWSPMWPVETRWSITSFDKGRSFVAELKGEVSDTDGEMHLSGVVTEGYRKGTRVKLDRDHASEKTAVLRYMPRHRGR